MLSVWITDIVVLFTDVCDSVICSHGDADRSPDVWAAYGKLCNNYVLFILLLKHFVVKTCSMLHAPCSH